VQWNTHCTAFLTMLGGQFAPKWPLSNSSSLIDELGTKIEDSASGTW
jgi:hypothetical protein